MQPCALREPLPHCTRCRLVQLPGRGKLGARPCAEGSPCYTTGCTRAGIGHPPPCNCVVLHPPSSLGAPEGSVPGSLEPAWLAGVQETMLGVLSAGSPSAPPADILASQTPPLYCPVRASPSLLSRLLHHVPFSPSAVVVCRLATPFFYFLSIRFLSRDVGCTRSVHIPFTGTSCRFPLLFYARLFFCSRRSGTIFSTVRLAAPEEPSPSSHTHTRHLSHCPAC